MQQPSYGPAGPNKFKSSLRKYSKIEGSPFSGNNGRKTSLEKDMPIKGSFYSTPKIQKSLYGKSGFSRYPDITQRRFNKRDLVIDELQQSFINSKSTIPHVSMNKKRLRTGARTDSVLKNNTIASSGWSPKDEISNNPVSY